MHTRVCLCVCACVCAFVCVFVCLCLCLCLFPCVCVWVDIIVCVCACVFVSSTVSELANSIFQNNVQIHNVKPPNSLCKHIHTHVHIIRSCIYTHTTNPCLGLCIAHISHISHIISHNFSRISNYFYFPRMSIFLIFDLFMLAQVHESTSKVWDNFRISTLNW